MACDQWQARLDTYLDSELPAEEMSAFDAHLRSCASCAADALARVQFKRAIQTAGKQFTPSTEFRNRVRQSIAVRPGKYWISSWVFATAALVILIIAALAWVSIGRQQLRREQLYSELADLHVATLASSTPVDVISSDRHTVKPWFQGKIPFTFNLPELQNSQFVLIGGRVSYLGQSPGAHLIYQIRKHEISVFIFQEQSMRQELNDNSPVMNRRSFNVETWNQGGLRYFIIGDAAAEDINSLSEFLKKAAAA